MSHHSNKYYHLIKALRVQKQQSEINKALRENTARKKHKQDEHLTCQGISTIIDLDNSTELDDKDSRLAIKLSESDTNNSEYSRIWQQFQKQSLTFKLSAGSMPIHRKIGLAKDQKLIDSLLDTAAKERDRREAQLVELATDIREQEKEVTVLKEQAIELSLQLEGFEKELVDLKVNFDLEEKKINERSTKYKEEKSKDIMIKNIDREDMEMRKAMASRIKLNQELDFGFQLQRRRAFNQAKAGINERKKAVQDKLNKLKGVINQHQTTQNKLIAEKGDLQYKNEILLQEQIYFCKQVVKNFKGHSRGIQWLAKLLKGWGVQLHNDDFPEEISKEDAAFVASMLAEIKAYKSDSRPKQKIRPKTSIKKNINQHFQTQPNLLIDEEKRNRTSLEKKKYNKTTVYFDIESQGGGHSSAKDEQREKATSFNINTKSLKKIYEHAGEVIGNMIKNHNLNYNSCRVITPSPAPAESPRISILERTVLEEKIKTKFISIRQKDRRNNLKKLLFGSS